MIPALLGYLLLGVADLVLTALILRHTGGIGEANPIYGWLYAAWGEAGLALGKCFFGAFLVTVLALNWDDRRFRWVLAVGYVIIIAAVLNNLWVAWPILW